MCTNFTVSMLKMQNKKSIFDYIYENKRTTAHMIAKRLNLSRPTIAQIIKELQQEELIGQNGYADSTGGRKANMYVFNSNIKIAIGVELLSDRYEIVAIDLYAEMLKYEKFTCTFAHTEVYYERVCESVNQFIEGLQAEPSQILGVGIALQGLISADGEEIIYGEILGCTGLHIKQFESRIKYTCLFSHDAEAIANEELWLDKEIKHAIFFNIRDNLSGAVIINRSFFDGGELKSGVFEHMTLVPKGLPCYCGKKGCLNSYCSTSALLKPEEDIQTFFHMLRKKKSQYVKRWDKYLDFFAVAIDNLRMFINSDVILGGMLARFLIEEDVVYLQELIQKRSAFPGANQNIKISKSTNLPLCMGAALPFVNKYIETVIHDMG